MQKTIGMRHPGIRLLRARREAHLQRIDIGSVRAQAIDHRRGPIRKGKWQNLEMDGVGSRLRSAVGYAQRPQVLSRCNTAQGKMLAASAANRSGLK